MKSDNYSALPSLGKEKNDDPIGISFDCDGVLYALEMAHAIHIKEEHDEDYHPSDVTYWDYIVDKYPTIVKVWGEWEHYSKGEIINDAKKAVKKAQELCGIENVRIVSSSFPDIIEEKTKMLSEALGIPPHLIFNIPHGVPKSKYTKDCIHVDDYHHHVEETSNTNGLPSILFDRAGEYGWSKGYQCSDNTYRCTDFAQMIALFEQLVVASPVKEVKIRFKKEDKSEDETQGLHIKL